MAQEHGIMAYGVILTEEQKQRNRERWFEYYKAKINAYKLYPEPDWEQATAHKLLKEIALANITAQQMGELILMLGITEDENE